LSVLSVLLVAERQVAISAPLRLPFAVLALALAAIMASVVVTFRTAVVAVSALLVRDLLIVAVISTGLLRMCSLVSRMVAPVLALGSAACVIAAVMGVIDGLAVDMLHRVHRGDAEQEQASDSGHVMGRDSPQLGLEARLEVVARRGLGRPDEEPEGQARGQAGEGAPGVAPTRQFVVCKALRDGDAHDLSRPPFPPVCGLIG
jgi:hypothetical protein